MEASRRANSRPRRAALSLLAALVLVIAVHLVVGLAPPVLYGLGGGIATSLVIIGRDELHRRSRRPPSPDRER